ncbi:MAG: WYL domain-containing protein [Cellvibrionales bacterium]|nr:WYL domain-containing protein [Cellvibrionales bacterium]MBK8676648.1 WYL domain-containing protein [Cellvibrionales bacterium]TXH51585.1 MAG: WYL domain-containing protein [Cellvibrionales bacterium]
MGSSTISATYRQWLMLQNLPRGRWAGTAELQQVLQQEGIDVNLRTIQRDLVAMAEFFPLESNGLSPQGWRWKSDAPATQLPHMTSSQALTFMMVEQHLKLLMPTSVLKELHPWFDNARQQMKQGVSPAHRWTDKVRIVPPTQPLIPPTVDAEALQTIQEAVLKERRIDALYDSRTKKKALNLELDPLAIVQRGTVLYLIAVGKSLSSGQATDAIRLFAMHRFKKAWLRDEKARKPKDFNLDDYLTKGGLGFGDGSIKKLKVIFSKEAGEHLYESKLSKDQVIKELPDGRLEVTATVADTPQLAWWLRGMGASDSTKKHH